MSINLFESKLVVIDKACVVSKRDMRSVIDGLVYDLTSFIPKHPGGRKIM